MTWQRLACWLSASCFFFSSRRRHTRCLSDWSSDVCSSDLFFDTFMLFYLFSGAVLTVIGAGNLLSGLCIRRRKYRIVSLLVACLNFILVPIGTVLGAFALVVLLRPSVRGAYEAGAARPAPPGGDLPGPTPGG